MVVMRGSWLGGLTSLMRWSMRSWGLIWRVVWGSRGIDGLETRADGGCLEVWDDKTGPASGQGDGWKAEAEKDGFFVVNTRVYG